MDTEETMKLLAALVVPLVGARVIRYEQQVSIVQTEVEDVATAAVGVHFTTSYVTAAARYENGTTVDLIRVCQVHATARSCAEFVLG